jgi:hypothetical protein
MAHTNDLRNIHLPIETLRALYRTFRSAALQADETASAFDAYCVWDAKLRHATEGISLDVLIVDSAACQARSALTKKRVARSPETEEWGGFLSGDILCDDSEGVALLAANRWPA